MPVPASRVAIRNTAPPRPDRSYVLYWMIAERRTCWNFALEHAGETAIRIAKPLVVFEPLRCDHRYALDGRDPNSYSGIFWVLGRYDRPWGPERPIFGTIRYMTSDNTARKMSKYLRRFGPETQNTSS